MIVKQFLITISLVLLTLTDLRSQEVSLKKVAINKDIKVALPEEFVQMTEQDINEKYISYRDPIALYTTQDRAVDFGVNLSVTHWKPEDLKIMQEFYENSIRSLYSEVNFIKKEIETINDIPYAVFEFESSVEGESNAITQTNTISKYTLIHYAIVNNKTVLFNFSSPLNAKDKWQAVAHEIMESIKIKKTL
jgi:hypothetical protein